MIRINKISICIVPLIAFLSTGSSDASVNFSQSDIALINQAAEQYPDDEIFNMLLEETKYGVNNIPLFLLSNEVSNLIKKYLKTIIDIIDMFVKKGQKICRLQGGNKRMIIVILLAYKPELLSKENLPLFFNVGFLEGHQEYDNAKIYKLLNEYKPIEEVLEFLFNSDTSEFIDFFAEIYREKRLPENRIEFMKNTFLPILIKSHISKYIQLITFPKSEAVSEFQLNEDKRIRDNLKSELKRLAEAILPGDMMARRDGRNLEKAMEDKEAQEVTAGLIGKFLSLDTAIDAITKKLTDQERVIWEEAVAEAKKEKEREIR